MLETFLFVLLCCILMQGLVQQLDLYAKLVGHEGCVNTVEFNSTGKMLVSGSDDKQVIFWDWASKKRTFTYSSGHLENIFQTKIMPFSDDRIIVTSAADGQVILAHLCIFLFPCSKSILSCLT